MLRGSDVRVFMPSVLSTASCIVESPLIIYKLTKDDLIIGIYLMLVWYVVIRIMPLPFVVNRICSVLCHQSTVDHFPPLI